MMSRWKHEQDAGHGWGLRVGTEIVASTMLALGAGYWLDHWLGTWPWLMLLLFAFGVVAGFINLYHAMGLGRRGRDDA